MHILDSPYTNPRYNIAAEEYLLKETPGDYAFFYVNNPSLIIGKHQNAYAEFNLDFIRQNDIPVIRRISGGGTVWHDEGNLNFSFILNGEEGKLVNFREYAQPIVDFLAGMNVKASLGPRNEILVNNLKISGNAEHVHRKRVLHHGTLLFDADLHALERSLRVDAKKYQDRAVQSVRSAVANITDYPGVKSNMAQFRGSLVSYFLDTRSGASGFTLGKDDENRIRELAEGKYISWEWNFGYSPKYRLEREFELDGAAIFASLYVEKGIIKEINLSVDAGDRVQLDELETTLKGERHDPGHVGKVCRELKIVKPDQIDKFVMNLF